MGPDSIKMEAYIYNMECGYIGYGVAQYINTESSYI